MAASEMSSSTAAISRLSGWHMLAVAGLLACYYVTALSAVATKSATVDECLHLTGGTTYWKFNDFRIHPENGNFPQRWAALPVAFGAFVFPTLDQDAWRFSRMDVLANQFFYGSGNDADKMLLCGRAMIALLGAALGLLIFIWTRRLLGQSAAFISLTLFAFCPTMLNNGALVTSDMAAGLFFFASVGCLWKVLNHLTWPRLLTSGFVMGCLMLSKVSGLLIVPIAVLLVMMQLASRQPLLVSWGQRSWQVRARPRRLAALLGVTAVHAVVVVAVIWSFYGFRYDILHATTAATDEATGQALVLDKTQYSWATLVDPEGGLLDRAVIKMREYRVLPEAYLYGVTYIIHFDDQRRGFLNGEYSKQGWPQFFPYCVLVKTPLPLFALMALGTAAIALGWWGNGQDSWRDRRQRAVAGLYRSAPFWTLFLVYWAVAIPSHLNAGHRHILPTYPPMIMLAGAAGWWLSRVPAVAEATRFPGAWRRPALAVITLLCVGLFAAESLWRWPNYLAYFNQIVGGPRYGYRHLVDSSLDWGQDLPGFKQWLDHEGLDNSPGKKIYLSYFGLANPDYYGIRCEALPSMPELEAPHAPQALGEGTYCISASMLAGVFTLYPGRWNREYEQIYQQLRANMARYESTADDPAARERLIAEAGGPEQMILWFQAFEHIRFARLCGHLLEREPDSEINYSMMVYRLDSADLARALNGPPPAMVD